MKHPVPHRVLDEWRRAHPLRVQAFAGRKRAAYWRTIGFPNLVRARIKRAVMRELSRNAYADEMVSDFMPDLAKAFHHRFDS